MKRIIFFTTLFIFLVGCSNNENEIYQSEAFDYEKLILSKKYNSIEIGAKTYGIKGDSIFKFENTKLNYAYGYANPLDFDIEQKFSAKGGLNQILLKNQKTEEYIIIKNINEIDATIFTFDVETSHGKFLENMTYNLNEQKLYNTSKKCPMCYPFIGLGLKLVEIIVDATADTPESICQSAVDQCFENGGFPTVNISDTWFDTECYVTCVERQNNE